MTATKDLEHTAHAWLDRNSRVAALLGAISVLRALPYLVSGSGLLLSDWSRVASAQFDGLENVSYPAERLVHPLASLVFTGLYGVIGAHPVLYVIVLTALATGTAVALFHLLARFVDRPTAFAVAGVWALLPTQVALAYWAASAAVGVGLVLLLVGVDLLDQGRWVGALVLLLEAGLCTELVVPVAFVAVLTLPRGESGVDRRARTTMAVSLAALAAWILWHPTRSMLGSVVRPGTLWSAHFGLGVAPNHTIGIALYCAAAAGVSLGLWRWWRGQRSAGSGPWLVAVGTVVLALGVVPILRDETLAPRGMSGRAYAVSSIGAALIWVGIAKLVTNARPAWLALVAGAFALVLLCSVAVAGRAWSRAAQDAVAVLDHVDERTATTAKPMAIVVGPSPPNRDGVTGLAGRTNSEGAWALRTGGRAGSLLVSNDQAEFDASTFERVLWVDVLAR